MRTFTNILLTSLATADLCVGVIVMPLALIDLLYRHIWPFGKMLCRIWATVDVLLCTASILNLCIISLDRYMAITSPLKYSRTRSRSMALGLLSCAWGISFVVCSPPWFVREWGIFVMISDGKTQNSFTCVYSPSIPYRIYSASGSFYIPLLVMLSMSRSMALGLLSCAWGISFVVCSPPWFVREWGIFVMISDGKTQNSFTCVYSPSIPYRIYSASGSFYIPLLVMLSMYFKIFRVASEREKTMRQSLGTCRLSRRIDKQQKKNNIIKNTNHNRCASAPISRVREFQVLPEATNRMNHSLHEKLTSNSKVSLYRMEATATSCDLDSVKYATLSNHEILTPQNSLNTNTNQNGNSISINNINPRFSIERESKSLVDLTAPNRWSEAPARKNTEANIDLHTPFSKQRGAIPPPPSNTRLHAVNLIQKAQTTITTSTSQNNNFPQHYARGGKSMRGSKEKIVYLRERKALKTIGIVVL
uniref:G-protein coupled receptors family 1 profile domain-containing protein n=1 Tax=Panagrolaimus sp. PS1159 TaxID=55785 RepID=A0AC35F0L8_9BILA